MGCLVDDVGSFPLPPQVAREKFDRAYCETRELCLGKGLLGFVADNFYRVVVDSFRLKLACGLDVTNYPQHYDMYRQLTDVISEATDRGTYIVDENKAFLPEVHVIREEAKRLSEEFGRKILLRVCIVGPLELYLKLVGALAYKDVALMIAETVKRFARNSILNSKYVKTEVISLDEPSFGFQESSFDKNTIQEIFEKSLNFSGVTKQVHLHSSLKATDLLSVSNLDVLGLECAASPRNIEGISKGILDNADKCVRIGVARTDVDTIYAELHDKGVTKPTPEQLVEDEAIIRKRFMVAVEKYGGRMLFAGPDCGLGGWPTQESAQLVLKRTVEATRIKIG